MTGPSSACGSGPGATTSGLIRDPNRLAFEWLVSARRDPRLRPVEPALHPPAFAELLLDGLQQRAHAHRIRAARMEAAARRRVDQVRRRAGNRVELCGLERDSRAKELAGVG